MKIREVILEVMTRDEVEQFKKDIERAKIEIKGVKRQHRFEFQLPSDVELEYRLNKAKAALAKHKEHDWQILLSRALEREREFALEAIPIVKKLAKRAMKKRN